MAVTKEKIIDVLKSIPDPELQISVWDLGLVYGVHVDTKGNVKIVMTLTSMGCPLFSLMEEPIKEKIRRIRGVQSVSIDLTFDPPWNVDKMSIKARRELGM